METIGGRPTVPLYRFLRQTINGGGRVTETRMDVRVSNARIRDPGTWNGLGSGQGLDATPAPTVNLPMAGLEAGGLAAVLAEAVAAIDGPVTAGPEGHHGVRATVGTHDRVHFPRRVLVHAASLLRSPNCPATPAAFRLVGEAAGVEKLLLAHGEDELTPALRTNKGPV